MNISKKVKKTLFSLIAFFLFFILLPELLTRIYFTSVFGPRILVWGTSLYKKNVKDKGKHTRKAAQLFEDGKLNKILQTQPQYRPDDGRGNGYVKYNPNTDLNGIVLDTKETYKVAINKQGFRGRDFIAEKPNNIIRVAALGASSTFGYFNRDHETYPHILEDLLNKKCKTKKFEVLNFGIPHLISEEIETLFRVEVLNLNPDVVTFYEGSNDTRVCWDKMRDKGIDSLNWDTFNNDTGNYLKEDVGIFIFIGFIRYWIDKINQEKAHTFKPVIEKMMDQCADEFLENIKKIYKQTLELGLYFIPMTQQLTTSYMGIPFADKEIRQSIKGITYDDEALMIVKKWDREKSLGRDDFALLNHKKLQNELRTWAKEQSLPLIDIIKILDYDRHYLLSWVHLHPDANKIIAEKISENILKKYCN